MRQQPAFWLEVRKEYVVENYESLLHYLRDYQYDAAHEPVDSDYNKTLRCLGEVVEDIRQQMAADNVFSHVAMGWETPRLRKNVGLIATHLLAERKKGITDNDTFLLLAQVLLYIEKAPDMDLLGGLLNVARCCAMGMEPVTYGFGWDDIEKLQELDWFAVFCQKLSKTNFKPADAEGEGYHFLEGKGLLAIHGQTIALAPTNRATYDKGEELLQFKLPMGVEVYVPKPEHTNKSNFPELMGTCTDILRLLDGVTPSPTKSLKTYEVGEDLVVRVTGVRYGYLECESVDPSYMKVEGRLYVSPQLYNYKNMIVVTREDLMKNVAPGDTLRVRLQENTFVPFVIDLQQFKKFNDLYIKNTQPHTCDAVYLESYTLPKGHGNRWLTDSGLLINILAQPSPYVQQAIDERTPIHIRIVETTTDKMGHQVANGTYLPEEESAPYYVYDDDFLAFAVDSIVRAFLDYNHCDLTALKAPKASTPISLPIVPLLTDIMLRYSQILGDATLRYLCLFAARFLTKIIGAELSAAFLHQQMRYQECLVHFALGDMAASALTLHDDPTLPQLDILDSQKAIIGILNGYHDMGTERPTMPSNHQVDKEYLREMVSSSNVLLGKLEPAEMNRIKKSIAMYLGMGDVYHNITRDYTDYGQESDTLEFKTSIVFPPNNNMQPDVNRQKWAILKAVCAFLNTMAGGEVLLGVNDYGISSGLQEDLKYLYQHGYTFGQTMDQYRLYVKRIIDQAFKDDQKATGEEVTSQYVNYLIEHNKEGDDVLHIQVRPYDRGIVQFSDETLPQGIDRCYYRTSGASVTMDKVLMQQVRERKKKQA